MSTSWIWCNSTVEPFSALWNGPDSWIVWVWAKQATWNGVAMPIATLLWIMLVGCLSPSFHAFRCMLLGNHLRGLEYRVELMQLLALPAVSESDAQDDEYVAWEVLKFLLKKWVWTEQVASPNIWIGLFSGHHCALFPTCSLGTFSVRNTGACFSNLLSEYVACSIWDLCSDSFT